MSGSLSRREFLKRSGEYAGALGLVATGVPLSWLVPDNREQEPSFSYGSVVVRNTEQKRTSVIFEEGGSSQEVQLPYMTKVVWSPDGQEFCGHIVEQKDPNDPKSETVGRFDFYDKHGKLLHKGVENKLHS